MMPVPQTMYVNEVIIKQLIRKVAGKIGRDQACGTIAASAFSRAPSRQATVRTRRPRPEVSNKASGIRVRRRSFVTADQCFEPPCQFSCSLNF